MWVHGGQVWVHGGQVWVHGGQVWVHGGQVSVRCQRVVVRCGRLVVRCRSGVSAWWLGVDAWWSGVGTWCSFFMLFFFLNSSIFMFVCISNQLAIFSKASFWGMLFFFLLLWVGIDLPLSIWGLLYGIAQVCTCI